MCAEDAANNQLETEALLIEQEHRAIKIWFNFIQYRRVDKSDPRRRASTLAFGWFWISPTSGAIFAGTLFSAATIFFLWQQNQKIEQQNRLISEQNTAILSQIKTQSAFNNQQVVSGKNTRVTELLTYLYDKVEGTENTPKFNQRIRSDAVKEYLELTESSIDLSGALLQDTSLVGVNFKGANLEGANFHDSDLSGANLSECSASHCDFSQAILVTTDFSNSELVDCNFSGATIAMTLFSNCLAPRADFTFLKHSTTDSRLQKYVSFLWSKGIKVGLKPTPGLTDPVGYINVNLENGEEYLATLSYSGAILVGARISYSSFAGSDIPTSVFSKSEAIGVDFTDSNLSESEFVDADLRKASFKTAIIDDCDFSTAKIQGSDLGEPTIGESSSESDSVRTIPPPLKLLE
ncbi:pentapeptide repeat-containing protein [Coraliomargarita akajimensis]|uniref:Pentapeptide repeat protein n=1 Tax=Coraliomargarita akajimensis (strain DSM 45221 / IAM 15411 / JCM 23193 / KCTC 12865 / 04OKA010-24) TaxID=583355 RepID=D5EL32_CORAD|nr:pentapeptide repeat-containing protein [Coraliomargarita akajimensis]ADE53134.1 pentapeptide repeat protein [Coraliomargarita akajimensis DSM 45221]